MKPPAKPPFNRPGPPQRHTTQLKPSPAKPGQNQPAGPRYAMQAPVPLAGRSQQIRATLNGTRQVAGSVDIRAAGPRKGFIANLKVEHEHRRRGVAAQLIDAAVNTARRQGFSSLSLEARPSDNGISPQALVAMYRRQGFKSVGRSHRGSPLMERKL